MPQQWMESIIVPVHKKDDETLIIIEESPSYHVPAKFDPSFF
ncbi:hypothetical protein L798_04571 [Zootermopsis nevadensis]|uniref:Uncharacterized protein n=1 Tax=Zootermopsis nevadensis TaxID=136037 RepID=A0A067RBF9_ZOONE|nr:hypothetical protein L798_04571 [Zootermopsis nevadensis]